MTSFLTTLMSVAFSESFSPLGDGPNFVHNESLKSRFVKSCSEANTACDLSWFLSL